MRLAGFGHPTSFLLPAEHAGKKVFVQKNLLLSSGNSITPRRCAASRSRPHGSGRPRKPRPGRRKCCFGRRSRPRRTIGCCTPNAPLSGPRPATPAGRPNPPGAWSNCCRHSAEGWGELGDALAQQEQFAAAAEAYAEAIGHEPDNFWARQNLARTYTRLGRPDEASREFRRAIQIKPHFGPAHLGLGQLLEDTGHKSEAEEHFRLALTFRVRRAAELTTLARFCHQRGWFKEAMTNYLDAIKLSPFEAPLHLGAGQCLVALDRSAESERYFSEAMRLAPGSGESCFLLGVEFGRQGRPVQAVEQFREAVRLLPNFLEARVNLGVALINLGEDAGALGQFEEVLRRSPTNTAAIQHAESLRGKTLRTPTPTAGPAPAKP